VLTQGNPSVFCRYLFIITFIIGRYNGKITGIRCSANIQSATFRAGGGIVGGIGGMFAFGMFLGPQSSFVIGKEQFHINFESQTKTVLIWQF